MDGTGINNFFNNATNALGSAMGNPVEGDGVNLNPQGNPWPHTFDYNPFGEVLTGNAQQSSIAGFLPPAQYKEFLNTPFVNTRSSGVAGGFFLTPDSFIPSPVSGLKPGKGYSGKDYKSDPKKSSPGFTPLSYYKTVSPTWGDKDPEYRIKIAPGDNELRTTKEVHYDNKGFIFTEGGNSMGDDRLSSFKYHFDDNALWNNESVEKIGSDGNMESEARYGLYEDGEYISSHDNEDPVYFGFEIELNASSSPLLNGTVENFIDTIGFNQQKKKAYTELTEKKDIIAEFKKELRRYFRISGDLPFVDDADNFIFESDTVKDKKFYINKLSGLHALNDRNSPDTHKPFVEYRKDKIGVTFFEDTTLNLGTLYSLYKSLYWSRLNGKSLMPENILRFDCKIIVSELRNLAAVKKAVSTGGEGGIEILKANVSRYVYHLYECQFFFEKPTHDDEINIGDSLSPTLKYDIEFDFKYSNMVFERFNPVQKSYAHIANDRYDPDGVAGQKIASNIFSKTVDGEISLKTSRRNGSVNESSVNEEGVDGMIQEEKDKIKNLYGGQIKPEISDDTGKDTKGAGQKFLNNLKTSALREAQRNLNSRFRLLNNSLSKVRESFGLTSQMSAPRNVYDVRNTGAGNFFFDVQNSLRDFGGDALGGLL